MPRPSCCGRRGHSKGDSLRPSGPSMRDDRGRDARCAVALMRSVCAGRRGSSRVRGACPHSPLPRWWDVPCRPCAMSSMPCMPTVWRASRSNRRGPRVSHRPWTLPTARLQHLLPQSPRTYGKPTGVWALALAVQVGHEQGVPERCRSEGKRAKHWSTRPAPQDARNTSGVIA